MNELMRYKFHKYIYIFMNIYIYKYKQTVIFFLEKLENYLFIVHAKWSLAFRSFATSSQRPKIALSFVNNNDDNMYTSILLFHIINIVYSARV